MAREQGPTYRYEITESGGCLAEQAPPGSMVVDHKYMGIWYTWRVVNLQTGQETGWMRGRYIGRLLPKEVPADA